MKKQIAITLTVILAIIAGTIKTSNHYNWAQFIETPVQTSTETI